MLETVTHARLRAQQGDEEGALRILRAVLARRPGDAEAAALLASLPGCAHGHDEPEDPPLRPPAAARAQELAHSFRRRLAGARPVHRRLQRFLAAVTRHAR